MPKYSPKQIRERIQARYGRVIDLLTLPEIQRAHNPIHQQGSEAILKEVVTARQYLNDHYQMAREIEDEPAKQDLLEYIANREWSLKYQETRLTGKAVDRLKRE